jgi:hypothetical protein
MFKYYFFACFFLTAALLPAQITLSSADLPSGGESILTSVATTVAPADPSLTGANYTWDFSSLTPNFQRAELFAAQSTYTGYYNQLYGNIPFISVPSTYGKDNFTLGLLPVPGFNVSSAYDFYKKTSSVLKKVGFAYTINDSLPLPFEYTQSDFVYKFPVAYMNTDSCNFKFEPHHVAASVVGALPFYYSGEGKRINTVDGWGTLITPFGSFSTLRIKSIVTETDSMNFSGTGFTVPVPTRTEYKWLAAGKKVPVLQVDESAGIVTNVTYLDSLRPGIPYIGIAELNTATEFSVFPNPASSDLVIQFTLSSSSKIRISILNTIGQTVGVVTKEHFGEGRKMVTVNLNEMNIAPGIYFVNLESNGVRSVKKIIVAK